MGCFIDTVQNKNNELYANALIHREPVLLPVSELEDESGVIKGILRSGSIKNLKMEFQAGQWILQSWL